MEEGPHPLFRSQELGPSYSMGKNCILKPFSWGDMSLQVSPGECPNHQTTGTLGCDSQSLLLKIFQCMDTINVHKTGTEFLSPLFQAKAQTTRLESYSLILIQRSTSLHFLSYPSVNISFLLSLPLSDMSDTVPLIDFWAAFCAQLLKTDSVPT